MEITTELQAEEAIAAVVHFLAQRAVQEPFDEDRREPRETAALARTLAHQLLDAGSCDGAGGCLLCYN